MNALNTLRSKHPRLKIINQWLQDRLQNPKEAKDAVTLQAAFVEDVLTDLTQALGIFSQDIIVTVRSAFREKSLYLRPVYSQPKELREFFMDPINQNPFSFPNIARALRNTAYKGEYGKGNTPYAFVALRQIGPDNGDTNDSFPARINAVHAKWAKKKDLGRLATKLNYCFFAGRNKAKVAKNYIELRHIIAIYFKGTNENAIKVKHTFDKLWEKTQDLFDGLDLISLIDASIFEAEGLKLVAELLPEFSRENVAPADKIAFAVERLGQLLTRHMIGRHGGVRGSTPAKLFYIATTFERQKDQHRTLHPRLEVYPHVYRKDHVDVSFFVTHRDIPSATKFLLWRYLKSGKHRIVETTSASKELGAAEKTRPVKVSPSFERMFEGDRLGTEPLKSWQDVVTPPESPDFLHLTRSDPQSKSSKKTPWAVLNRAAELGCRSIAAFVVEGRVIHTVDEFQWRCLPRGIFAIESHYEDGFSDADVNSLRIVFRGLASLVRLISHQHSPIDYRSVIARTFDQDVEPESRDDQRVSRLLFLVQKLDAELFRNLLPRCRKDPKSYGLDARFLPALEAIETICPGYAHPTPEKRAEILRQRMRQMQQLLFDRNPESEELKKLLLSPEVLAFLEACPENFTWASYLACMAQTLGDRIDAGTELPQFSRMVPGFSASGMFMAMVDGELRQVVKLSTAEKLRNEARLYRKWVRYRLVNAARIPVSTGLAFETTGWDGKNSHVTIVPPEAGQNAESDGVLVSDLVSGGQTHEDKVRTFLDLVAKNLGGLREELPDPEKIKEELDAVFGRNAKLWKTVPEGIREDTLSAVVSAFRIPKRRAKERKIFEAEIGRLQALRASGRGLDFGSLIKQWGSNQAQNVSVLEREHFRICHGDLNARNLTWAEGLQSFFLIDFEFVGPNPNGTDQFRLIVNLVTELWTGLNSVKSPDAGKNIDEFNNLHTALTLGLDYLKDVFATLMGHGGESPLSVIAEDSARKHPSELTDILKTILVTVDPDQKLGEAKWRFHWALMLLCSAAKEFSYTCRATMPGEAEAILNRKKVDTITLPELEEAIKKHAPGRPGTPTLKGDYMHHFMASRLLLSFADVLDNRGDA